MKNVLVFAAPGAAGLLAHPQVLARSIVTFAIFCVSSGGTYFLNDAIDVRGDRLHPTKCSRPVAAGRISLRRARVIAVVMLSASITLSGLVRPELAAVTALYVVITVAYTLWLKCEPVLDIAAVASGFVVRAVAGGVATSVTLSPWFLIVALFGSLLMVSGKRHAELAELGDQASRHRATLAQYSLSYLRYIRSVSSSAAIVAYCLWVFDKSAAVRPPGLWFELSVAPFVLAILRYSLILDSGGGAAPEDVVFGDRPLQAIGLVWLTVIAIGLYAH